ncbi:MAG TPA: Gfo/Idh/MocA family oxidoreductase [Candidatus Paenibacillus intestinavium]|nr:Gfo/Idh/MocA family oxidoreductase [Candidatus Paenibacillus intestinavium]
MISLTITNFAIVGGGWRAEFYMRIAKAMPDHFCISTMLVRNEEKGKAIEEQWGICTVRTMEELIVQTEHFDFVVVAVAKGGAQGVISQLSMNKIPVLIETPPATDLNGLVALYHSMPKGAQLQVAEQYLFQPLHAARIQLVSSGKLGDISHVQMSVAHEYHGISLIRQLLGVGFEEVTIRGEQIQSLISRGPSRDGGPETEGVVETSQQLATLRFGNKLAVYDFSRDQYFSWIRRSRIVIRGSQGEIVNEEASYLVDFNTPVHMDLRRVDKGHGGNLEGYYHKGIIAGERWLYLNPTAPARLSDEEIAIATSLLKMADYVTGASGSFYSLADAAQDQYLSLLMLEAIETGETVVSTRQIWAMEEEA